MDKKIIDINLIQRKGGLGMNTFGKIKPIQATPELSGKDALAFIEQVFTPPSESELNRNKKLLSILKNIQE